MKASYGLKVGDEIRIIAPSLSWSNSKRQQQNYDRAKRRLESLGYKVTFGKNIDNIYHQGTGERKLRAEDINSAYADDNVKAILALDGGWSANEILPLINWEVLQFNPKPLIGFSDITVLLNALYAKTGQTQFLGPNFGTLGKAVEWQYTLKNFHNATTGKTCILKCSNKWGGSIKNTKNTKPWKVLQKGFANATLIGGNLGTFYLLQGTEFCPKFDKPFIFALEDDDESNSLTIKEVSRRFESLLQIPGFHDNLCGLIVGRFESGSKTNLQEIADILFSKNLPKDIPIALNLDFGHTLPMLTLPIGSKVLLDTNRGVKLEINY